jgi:hypothetical protein
LSVPPALSLVEVGGDQRGDGQLGEGLEEVEGVVVAAAGGLGVVGPAVQLGQVQRQTQQVLTLESGGHAAHSHAAMHSRDRSPSLRFAAFKPGRWNKTVTGDTNTP